MPQAVDYSFSRPNPADLAAAGFRGALRYLCPLPNAKAVTGDEIASLHANGIAIGFVWESGASRAGQGESAGHFDAWTANDQADQLGIPATVPLYFAVDYDAVPAAVAPYFKGAREVSKRPVGVYGSYRIVEAELDAGCSYGWQTAAWSHGQRSPRAHLFQRADAAANPPPGTDVNDILQDDWGQWSPNGGSEVLDKDDPIVKDIVAKINGLTEEMTQVVNPALTDIAQKLSNLEARPVGDGSGTPQGDIPATVHFP